MSDNGITSSGTFESAENLQQICIEVQSTKVSDTYRKIEMERHLSNNRLYLSKTCSMSKTEYNSPEYDIHIQAEVELH